MIRKIILRILTKSGINKTKPYNADESEYMVKLHGVELASFITRLFAFYFDLLATVLLFMIIVVGGFLLLQHVGIIDSKQNLLFEFDFHTWYSLIFVVIYFGYFTYQGNGRTPGKRLAGIRVVSLTHDHISLWQSFERALGYGASMLELGFGFYQFFINPNRRTVHDRIADTIVIKEKKNVK